MVDFNVIKWVVKQPKEILIGLIIFASSYLGFFKINDGPISTGEHILWIVLFLSVSLLLGFLLSFLARQAYSTIRNRRANPYSGRPPRKADNILKLFVETQHGVLAKIAIVDMTNFNPNTVQYLMDQLEGRGFVESYIALDPDDNRYVLTEKGRTYMAKRRKLK